MTVCFDMATDVRRDGSFICGTCKHRCDVFSRGKIRGRGQWKWIECRRCVNFKRRENRNENKG